MKRIRWILLLTAVLLLCGCGKQKPLSYSDPLDGIFRSHPDGSFTSGNIHFPLEETVTFSYLVNADTKTMEVNSGNLSNNAFWKELERRTNVKFQFVTIPAGGNMKKYLEQLPASEFPDLVMLTTDYKLNEAFEGRYLDLTDLLPQYAPDYSQLLSDSGEEYLSKLGDRIYGISSIYRENPEIFAGLVIRKDWLDELRLPVPETYDDMETVLRAFKNQKGCKAPLALTARSYQNFAVGYDVYLDYTGDVFYFEDGKVKSSLLENPDGCLAFLKRMHSWYQEGLISPNFILSDTLFADANYLNSGMSGVAEIMYTQLDTAFQPIAESGGELASVLFPVMEDGEKLQPSVMLAQNRTNCKVVVSGECRSPEILLGVLNYLFTEEGSLLADYGIEGETYELDENGLPRFTQEMLDNLADNVREKTMPPGWGPYYASTNRLIVGEARKATEMIQKEKSLRMPELVLRQEMFVELERSREEIRNLVRESFLAFITGQKDFDEWEDFLSQLDEEGIRDFISAYQKACDEVF